MSAVESKPDLSATRVGYLAAILSGVCRCPQRKTGHMSPIDSDSLHEGGHVIGKQLGGVCSPRLVSCSGTTRIDRDAGEVLGILRDLKRVASVVCGQKGIQDERLSRTLLLVVHCDLAEFDVRHLLSPFAPGYLIVAQSAQSAIAGSFKCEPVASAFWLLTAMPIGKRSGRTWHVTDHSAQAGVGQLLAYSRAAWSSEFDLGFVKEANLWPWRILHARISVSFSEAG